jgi:hypothetical protein
LLALLTVTPTATLSKALVVSKPESEGKVGLVEHVRISWYHVIPCRTVGAVPALQEEDKLGHPPASPELIPPRRKEIPLWCLVSTPIIRSVLSTESTLEASEAVDCSSLLYDRPTKRKCADKK